eukprot:scaffold16006_cov110-Isochrysis_galbana.AAC.2
MNHEAQSPLPLATAGIKPRELGMRWSTFGREPLRQKSGLGRLADGSMMCARPTEAARFRNKYYCCDCVPKTGHAVAD